MPFQIVRNDITKVAADVIVNTANPLPVIGSGTDSAIYAAAGECLLLAEREKIGNIEPGQAAYTPAFGLKAKYIIHTVGPAWEDGKHGERDILRSCYVNSLVLADKLKAESIAFPLISTGVYGFPKEEALDIAMSEIGKFLLTHDMKIILVVFDKESFELSAELIADIDEFIDEYGVGLAREAEYGYFDDARRRRRIDEARRNLSLHINAEEEEITEFLAYEEAEEPVVSPFADFEGKTLDQVVSNADDSFSQKLFKLIDASGMQDSQVYGDANVGRQVFSNIRCKKDYQPTKKTAVALSIALHLDMPTMLDLLSRAGITLSRSNKFDLIIAFFVMRGDYSPSKIDSALWEHGLPTVFSLKK